MATAAGNLRTMGAAQTYRQLVRRRVAVISVCAALLLLSVTVDIAWGPARLTPIEVIQTILSPGEVSAGQRVIVWDIRMPVALLAVLVGAALAVSGAEMQTILNNPLASPFTLGISAAASFGAALAVVTGFSVIPFSGGDFALPLNAFAFAMTASMMVYVLSKARGVTTESMVLVGIALVFLFSSLLAMLQYVASPDALQQIVFWTMGSLMRATWTKVLIMAVLLAVTLPYFWSQSWKLTALRLGDAKAQSLGVDTDQLRLRVLIMVSLLASAAVSFVGTIGFVGLVGPHVARLVVGEDHRYFLPTSALAGALLLSLTAIVSKSIIPGVVLPVGIITSLVGIPFFLSLILIRRRNLW